ncbi:unnamed protein product [Bemisia tabaci]|uniref:Protein Wnt n=1 Tax=Bemisia tabaci TaxID=7038 RepID=A0A9P0C5K7_BEMTA|nr:PREDICTED: protein Wnt-1-like [Bemisia tabaci]CAH0772084.1 unnamed protein product [Bemisia tabaci]
MCAKLRLLGIGMALARRECLHSAILFFFLLLGFFLDSAHANWRTLGLTGINPAGAAIYLREKCTRPKHFGEKLSSICSYNDNILQAVANGAKMGIEECQHQFSMSRWNCSTFANTTSVFGGVTDIRSRETAYVFAISSAGVAYSVTKACSKGELNECSCDHKVHKRKPRRGNWQWGGCSEDINFGEKFSRTFVDSEENSESAFGLMNIHNNEAGRRIIRSQMKRICKCHGMSGSCNVRVCWRKLPTFRAIGDVLMQRYEGASYVRVVERRQKDEEKRKKRGKKLRAANPIFKQPNRTELVFLDPSPDYCERNETLGILGTHGRQCVQGSPRVDGCSILCCGRGYQTKIREVEENCNCKFFWCCKVKCETCHSKKEEHFCN